MRGEFSAKIPSFQQAWGCIQPQRRVKWGNTSGPPGLCLKTTLSDAQTGPLPSHQWPCWSFACCLTLKKHRALPRHGSSFTVNTGHNTALGENRMIHQNGQESRIQTPSCTKKPLASPVIISQPLQMMLVAADPRVRLGSSQPRVQTHVSYICCIGRRVFYH